MNPDRAIPVVWVGRSGIRYEITGSGIRNAKEVDRIRMIPDILQNGDDYFFPVFSSSDEMGEYGEHFSTIGNHFLEVINLARNNEKDLAGIVVNAFTEPFVLNRDLFEVVEKMKTRLISQDTER